MNSINLFIPSIFDVSIDFPSTWNEMTTPEMELLATAQLADEKNQFIGKVAIFTGIMNMRAKAQDVQLPKNWHLKLNFDDAATQGLDCLSFMFEKNDRTINPYPVLRLATANHQLQTSNQKQLIGPANDFDSITCAEMEQADIAMLQFTQDDNFEHLAQIASILWRPRNAPYNAEASEAMLPHFKKLSPVTLFVMYTWYAGCRNQLPRYFPDVYGGTGSKGPPDYMAFTKCIHAGAGPKNGKRDEIRVMLAKEFLFDAQLEAEQAKKLKAEYDKH